MRSCSNFRVRVVLAGGGGGGVDAFSPLKGGDPVEAAAEGAGVGGGRAEAARFGHAPLPR